MTISTRQWLHGLIAGFIGAMAGALDSSIALMLIAPDKFNLGAGIGKTLEAALVLGLLSGGKAAFAYLKQSPLPREEWTDADRQAVAAGALPAGDADKKAAVISDAAAAGKP